nr:10418_t:CDS:2 [Entrophospora candida]
MVAINLYRIFELSTATTACALFILNSLLFVNSQYANEGQSSLNDVQPLRACNGTDIDIRGYDGSCNNIKRSNWGVPNRVFDRVWFDPKYEDNFTGAPFLKVDSRMISNLLSDDGLPVDYAGNPLQDGLLSDFFGQFINHDLEDSALQNGIPGYAIADVTQDPIFKNTANNPFNPSQTPFMMITLSLGRILNNTFFPANTANAYLDLSNIYGNDSTMNTALRDPNGRGLMLLEDYTTDGGAYNTKLVNVTVKQMPPSPLSTDIFPNLTPPPINASDAMVSGDTRCSENIQLCIMHAIWIREHNFWAKKLLAENPTWDDTKLFENARRATIAEYQNVIFSEYLPALLGFKMPPYSGYDENVYADTSAVFAGAAFRYGHSNIRPYNIVDGCTGKPIVIHPDYSYPNTHPNRFMFVGKTFPVSPVPGSALTRKVLDYTPARILALASGTHGDGVDNVIVSMLREPTAQFDLKITSALRNIPGVTDLFAIDISRGRFMGLADYNTYRTVYHPAGSVYSNAACDINAATDSVACFQLITKDVKVATNLQQLYKKVNAMDAIVGFFAEDRAAVTTPLPPTITNIIKDEFDRKRIGDRFWYEGTTFTDAEKAQIKATTMKQIIERTTGVKNVQINPFKAPIGNNLPTACTA